MCANLTDVDDRSSFNDDEYVLEQKVLSLGSEYYIKDSQRQNVGYCFKKPLKIKKEFSVFRSDKKKNELFKVLQRNMLDLTGLYEVVQASSNKTVGHLKRNLLKGSLLDEWKIMDKEKQDVGRIIDNTFFRRALRFKGLKKIPYRYTIYQENKKIGVCKKRVSLFKNMYKLQIRKEPDKIIDRRLLISMLILLDEVEEKFRKIQK